MTEPSSTATLPPPVSRTSPAPGSAGSGLPGDLRTFLIETWGCQMNEHDSETIANLLYPAGYQASEREDDADVLIVNTCSIRDKAEHQL
ncbi:MAG: tRNA (N6-isopentenyl adenosine(37)-C2)-methylthiotransferase MiaB, partial [Acidobacteriota bacterium]